MWHRPAGGISTGSLPRIEDWAKGPRYRVRATTRPSCCISKGIKVVGAYVKPNSGQRRNICRNADCYSHEEELPEVSSGR
jgi:hypothetical protein